MTDWKTCPAVERNPHKISGAWAFTGMRVPVYALFENLESGATVKEFLEWYPDVEEWQVRAVLDHEVEYLKTPLREESIMRFDRITVNPVQMGGVPCVRGLRIPVATVVGLVAQGMTEAQIAAEYPDLEVEDICEALAFAAAAVDERQLPLLAGA